MKNTTLLFLTALLIISCTGEPKERLYTSYIKNESGHTVHIEGYDLKNKLIASYTIQPNEAGENCKVYSEGFIGYSCKVDSLVLKFNNGKKGYICSRRQTDTIKMCFDNGVSPLVSDPGFKDIGNNTFEFVITQEDYNNAFELPE